MERTNENFMVNDVEYKIIADTAAVVSGEKFKGSELIIQSSVEFEGKDYSVTEIGWNAFRGCTSLTSINIHNGVTAIGSFAFEGCTSLTSITIPESVTWIGDEAFKGCTSLTSITIPDGMTGLNLRAFDGCSLLFREENGFKIFSEDIIVDVIDKSITNIDIPSGIKRIYGAFNKCISLISVIIPDSVIEIGLGAFKVGAFKDCTSLTSITIPESVTWIADTAFEGCTSLTSITIPESVTEIGGWTFRGCTSLTSINIPNCVTKIGVEAFGGCTSLTSITIPESVTEIGGWTFKGCTSLTSITIPESVTRIGRFAFEGCTSLTSITIPESVTEIGDRAFTGCTSLTSITIPESVTTIDMEAFKGCTSLISITIPESVTEIWEGAFDGCTSLTSVTIMSSTTKIGKNAFKGCTSLKKKPKNTKVVIKEAKVLLSADVFDCYCCADLTKEEAKDYITNPGDIWDNSDFDFSYLQWGYLREISFNNKDITKKVKFPSEDDPDSSIKNYFNNLKPDTYCVVRRNFIYKSNWEYNLKCDTGLAEKDFHLLKLDLGTFDKLATQYSPFLFKTNSEVVSLGKVECKGEIFEGEFDSDMGDQDVDIMIIEVNAKGELKVIVPADLD